MLYVKQYLALEDVEAWPADPEPAAGDLASPEYRLEDYPAKGSRKQVL